jgi:hypothetical protein
VKIRWPFVVAFIGACIWGATEFFLRANRQTEILAVTECPLRGEPHTTVSAGLTPMELSHVNAHEGVHILQCKQLGPIKFRIYNLVSRLSMEIPAYCAGASAYLSMGLDSAGVKGRLVDDAVEALRRTADSAEVISALEETCPVVMRKRMRSPFRIGV